MTSATRSYSERVAGAQRLLSEGTAILSAAAIAIEMLEPGAATRHDRRTLQRMATQIRGVTERLGKLPPVPGLPEVKSG